MMVAAGEKYVQPKKLNKKFHCSCFSIKRKLSFPVLEIRVNKSCGGVQAVRPPPQVLFSLISTLHSPIRFFKYCSLTLR